MNKLLRTIWRLFRSRRSSKLTLMDTGVVEFRVRPTDLDIQRHMNNGVYLSIADLGRFDLLVRSGFWDEMQQRGWYPVVANATISYRKSLDPGMRYELRTRMVGIDEKAVYLEQRFVVKGEIYAEYLLRGRFLKKGGGVVSVAELAEVAGLDVSKLAVPEWINRWAADVALPSTKQPAPSDW